MSELSSKTFCVVDNGIFFDVARRLAPSVGRVLYHVPLWQRGFPTIHDGAVGDGFDEVEWCGDFWPLLDEIDCFVFPDIQHSGLQLHLEEMGKPVWGSRAGDSLEIQREKFLKTLKSVGLDTPKFIEIKGLSRLRDYLQENDDKFIKISRWRRDLETFHHVNYDLSRTRLDSLAIRFGAVQEEIPFLVFDPIDTDLEVGYDGYCIDGQYPSVSVYGIEKKDKGYIGAVRKYEDLPEQVIEVNEALSSIFGGYRYRNFFSSEIRIKGDKAYFIDPTCRLGMPSGDAQLTLYSNLAEIIWGGAHGELVDPEPVAGFCAQVLIEHNDDFAHWRELDIPKAARPWVSLLYPCKIGDMYAIAPTSEAGETIGSVLGIGDTIQEAIEHVKENAELIAHNNITVNTDSLVDVLKDIQASEDKGVPFTEEEIPAPESVLEDQP